VKQKETTMKREFILNNVLPKPVKVHYTEGAFELHQIGEDEFKIRIYDADDKIEDTLIFTKEQVRCLYYLLTK